MKTLLAGLAAMLLQIGAAQALTLDFSADADTYQASPYTVTYATITSSGPELYLAPEGFGTPSFGPDGGLCGVTTVGGVDCATVLTFEFSLPIADLSFVTNQPDAGDVATATVFNGATELDTATITTAGTTSFAGVSGITSLVIDASDSTGLGFVYGDFAFSAASAAVPAPAAAPLLLGALGGFAWLRRRQA